MNEVIELLTGTLHREIAKAREEAIIAAIDNDYGYFHWRIYSDEPQLIELYGRRKQHDTDVKLATIKYSADFRSAQPLSQSVSLSTTFGRGGSESPNRSK